MEIGAALGSVSGLSFMVGCCVGCSEKPAKNPLGRVDASSDSVMPSVIILPSSNSGFHHHHHHHGSSCGDCGDGAGAAAAVLVGLACCLAIGCYCAGYQSGKAIGEISASTPSTASVLKESLLAAPVQQEMTGSVVSTVSVSSQPKTLPTAPPVDLKKEGLDFQ